MSRNHTGLSNPPIHRRSYQQTRFWGVVEAPWKSMQFSSKLRSLHTACRRYHQRPLSGRRSQGYLHTSPAACPDRNSLRQAFPHTDQGVQPNNDVLSWIRYRHVCPHMCVFQGHPHEPVFALSAARESHGFSRPYCAKQMDGPLWRKRNVQPLFSVVNIWSDMRRAPSRRSCNMKSALFICDY